MRAQSPSPAFREPAARQPRLLAVLMALAVAVGLTLTPPGGSPVTAACGSLQAMVNAAPAGSTITVPACVYHERVRITKPLTINATGAVVDGDSIRDTGVVVVADDVTINGLTVTHVNTTSHVGAVWSFGVSRFTFRGGAARDSGRICLALDGGSGHRVLDSELTGCGEEGYFMNGVSDTLFAGNHIHHNNTALAWDPADEAGGGKAMASQRVTFDRNEVDHNGGPGIWFDNGVVDAVATNNRVHDNDRAGIFFEISDGAEIANNAVWKNGFGYVAWGYGAGITISSSDRAIVHGNTVAWNARGISVISQARLLQPHTGNVVHDNVVISQDADLVAGWYDDHGDTLFSPGSGNTGYGDRFWVGVAEPSVDRFAWGGPIRALAAYNATPGEEGATYLSDAARDAALAAAGIPGIDGTPPSASPGPTPTPTPGPPSASPGPTPPSASSPPTPLVAPVPAPVLGPGEMTASAAVPGRITWASATGATAYQVQIQRNGGGWASLATAGALARSARVTYTGTTRYRARVRARDATGAWSRWVTGSSAAVVRSQETAPAIAWTGAWTRARLSGASGAAVRFATNAGATASFTFTGRAVSWVAPVGPTRGSARVYVDGTYRTTVSLYRLGTIARSLVFSMAWSSSGPHHVVIRVVGTGGHPRIDVDAFLVLR